MSDRFLSMSRSICSNKSARNGTTCASMATRQIKILMRRMPGYRKRSNFQRHSIHSHRKSFKLEIFTNNHQLKNHQGATEERFEICIGTLWKLQILVPPIQDPIAISVLLKEMFDLENS